ncbi:MAG: hypothetical protein WBN85_04585 [Candidatus Macondimonas sp.]
MRKSGLIGLALALAMSFGQAEAAGYLSNSVLERAYQANMALDGLSSGPRQDTLNTHPLTEHLFLSAGYRSSDQELGGFTLPLDVLSAGVGGQYALRPLLEGVSMDLFGGMSYLSRNDMLFGTDQWRGYGLGGGLRMGIQNAFELEFGVLQNALDNTRDHLDAGLLRYSLGALYRLTPNLGLTASYMTGEYEKDLSGQDLTEWRLGARFGF